MTEQENTNKNLLHIDPQEVAVGITEYLNQGEQIVGTLKYRFSDFVVNEIDRRTKQTMFFKDIKSSDITFGFKLAAQQQKIQEQQNQQQQEQIEEEKKQGEQKEEILNEKGEKSKENEKIERKIQESDVEDCKQLLGEENTENIQKFYEDWVNGEKKTFYEFSVKAPSEKENRQKIHEFVRESLPYFDSSTKEDQIVIKFTRNISKKGKFAAKKKMLLEQIFQFTLFKINVDTNTAIGQLAQFLRIPQKSFGVAGLKDKRGITTQKVTISNQKQVLDNFIRNMKNYKSKNLFTGDYEIVKYGLKAGDLYGNRFTIGFRLAQEPNKQLIQDNIDRVQKDGFINYYGLQRFGQGEVKSYEIGIHLLKKEFKEAADKILFANGLNYQDVLDEYKKTNNAQQALEKLPKHLKRERDMISFYKKHGTNSHFECLQSLPRNVKDLYPHAYQSYIWNKLASLRVKKFGKKLAIGDIVQIQQNNNNQEQGQDNQGEENEFIGINQIKYEYVNEENIDKYSINDLLIPIIGCELELDYEKFNLGQEMKNMLEEDGITFEMLEKQNMNFFLTGGYRKLIFVVENLEHKFVQFNSADEDFLTPFYDREEDVDSENGQYTALVLRFTLQKGCYATMLIRELTKVSSSYQSQQTINNLFENLK